MAVELEDSAKIHIMHELANEAEELIECIRAGQYKHALAVAGYIAEALRPYASDDESE